MIQTIRKAWGIPELRKKIIFTLLILLIFRIGNAITVPYVNTDALKLQLDMTCRALDTFRRRARRIIFAAISGKRERSEE